MATFVSVMLICAAGVPTLDCTRETAIDVMAASAQSPFECLMQGQTVVAGTALADRIGNGTYLKVVCERHDRMAATSEPIN